MWWANLWFLGVITMHGTTVLPEFAQFSHQRRRPSAWRIDEAITELFIQIDGASLTMLTAAKDSDLGDSVNDVRRPGGIRTFSSII